jgi:segregation and condensation protein B
VSEIIKDQTGADDRLEGRESPTQAVVETAAVSDSSTESRENVRSASESAAFALANLDFIDGASAPYETESTAEVLASESSPGQSDQLERLQKLAEDVAETVAQNAAQNAAQNTIQSMDSSESEEWPAESTGSSWLDLAPESQMMVGESEQLPILGLEEPAAMLDEAEDETVSDEPREFIEHDRLVSVLESLLFSTDKPVSVATMRQLFKGSNIRTKDIQQALDLLASEYASAQRGVTLEEIHGGYQLRTKIDNTEYLKRLAKVRPFRLSGPALEVMAIVAYKQPITKGEVDQIRGVESGHLLRALMDRGLVNFGEKSELPGKPMTYLTTRKFLEIFGLRNLKELPTLSEIDELLPDGIGDEADGEKEKLSDLTSAMSNEIKGTYSEGEEELEEISKTLQVIDTTSEFFEQEKLRQRAERDRERAQDLRERLTIGETLDSKDARWLSRYEAQLERAAQAAEAGQAVSHVVVEDEGVASEASPLAEKGDLQAESVHDSLGGSMREVEHRAEFESEESGEFDEGSGDESDSSSDLAAKLDYDDTEVAERDARFDDMDGNDSEAEGRDRDADGHA